MSAHGSDSDNRPPDDPPLDDRALRAQQREQARAEAEAAAAASAQAAADARATAEADAAALAALQLNRRNDEEADEGDTEEDEPNAGGARGCTLPKGAVKIPEFHGDSNEARHASPFLEQLECYYEVYGINSTASRLAILYSCFPLKSVARSWFTVCKRNEQFTSYKKFTELFLQRFGLRATDRFRYEQKLQKFRQNDHETIGTYYTNLMSLYSSLSLCGVEYDEGTKVQRFLTGMIPEIQKEVERDMIRDINAFATVDDVFVLADNIFRNNINRILREKGKGPRPLLNVVDAENDNSEQPPSTNLTCKFCHKPGHKFDDCPKVIKLKEEGKWDYNRSRH